MKNRNTVSLQMNASDSFEVYTANITPENHNLHINQKVPIPTIRLTQATPSDTSIPSVIAPKSSPRRKIVPKKSKLALLSTKAAPPREKDLSDILRRVNTSTANLDGNATCNVTVNGGTTMKMKDLLKFKDRSSRSTIDIYVDPADDPDIGEIVVVKKKKSRAKLDGLFDGQGNVELKEEPKEESKWWSIRGRKKERLRNHSLNALKINVTEANTTNTVFSEARQRCGSTPLSPSDSGYADSIALRAMKSIARIGSWAQLKNSNLPRDTHQVPPGSRVKSSISSFEIGALSTHTGEDLTNRLSPMGSLSHCPPGSHKFLNPSITNTSVRTRTSSCGTVLSVTSPYLQPCDNRRLSTSSSSGESNRPGSTYTASGEDTGALGIPIKASTAKSKKSMSVKWGSVSSALALAKGKKKSEKERLPEKDKPKERNNTSKSSKRFPRAEDVSHSNQDITTNVSSKDKEDQSKKFKGSHRHTIEGRKRTHVMSVFPGLTFGRSADLHTTSVKTSMPSIAEDPNRSCEHNSRQEGINEPSDRPNTIIPEKAWPARNNNTSELSDSDSDLWNREDVSDEEACVRLSIRNPRGMSSQATKQCNVMRDGESPPAARPRPRPRPASEQLLGSNRIMQGSRPVGIVVDVDIDKYKDKQDVLALSVLEAANSDLASLINRLDLEATPDKDRDIAATYADAIAAWRASGSATQNVRSTLLNPGDMIQQPMEQDSTTCPVVHSPSDVRCSIFRENVTTHQAQSIKLTYRDPIAFLDPTVDSSADIPSSAVGESFAFINSANGALPEDSPLHLLGKVRAITRAMGAATGATGGTMSKRFSAISASTRASVTSLRPYAFAAFKNRDENVRNIDEVATGEPKSTYRDESVADSYPTSEGREQSCAIISSKLSKQFEVSSRSSVPDTQGFGTSFKEAPFNRMSRASSIASTFGTRAVLAKTQLRESAASASLIPYQADIPLHKMSEEQKPPRYALPPLGFGGGSPVPLYTSQFSTEDSPTPPTRARGHIRQSSGLVPISQRPIPRGSNVRRKVEYIEQLARFEHEQGEQERKGIARRCAVKHTVANDRPSTSSCTSDSSRSYYSPSFDEGISLFVPGPMIAKGEDFGFADEGEQPDSDIPNELKDVLSANGLPDGSQGLSPSDAHSLLYLSSTPAPCNLPPSPGLPPTGPLPIPESKVILPTPTSINDLGITLEPSPPAPSLLPVIDPSPSPETFKPSSLLPTLRLAPPPCEQAVSDDGDVEEFIPLTVLRSALSTSGSGSEDDTKQSFDFTGELKRLNESGGSHRLSFVEQLDAAFKTPHHVTTRGGFEIKTTATEEFAPGLISTLEGGLDMETEEGLSMMVETLNESMSNLGFETSYPSKHSSPMQMSGEVMPKPSYGRLDTAFKFGGRPPVTSRSKELALNSVALELPGVAALSTSPSSQLKSYELPRRPSVNIPASPVEEDSSVLRSIYVHAAANDITQLIDVSSPDVSDGSNNLQSVSHQSGLRSDTSSKYRINEEMARAEKAKLPTHARQSSDVSFLGFSSFGAVRTKFEFGPDRPDFYSSLQMSQASMTKSHLRHESLFSIASVSSYGEVIKPGMMDPFNYGALEDKEARDRLPALDSFSDRKRNKRFSTDSDVSSFYFRPDGHSHTRNQSVLSTNSINGPPISLYNRTFSHGHRRNDSGGSMSSVAAAYSIQGANGGRAAWMRHQQERSVDSTISEFSRMRLGRPGVGDKMFESIGDHYPLSSISASPPESVSGDLAQKTSYDSILDDERRSTVDSIFDNTGHRSSISSDSVFWHDPTNEKDQSPRDHHNLFPPANLFRPLSLCSTGNHETSREDDTLITMLGGEHVRRRSLGSSFEASPCFRVEKQKREFHHDEVATDDDESPLIDGTSPTAKIGHNARFIHDELSASAKSNKFGETRMNLARKGLLHRESLEDSCLSADGEEDLSMVSTRSKTFSRPVPRRQRKPVVTITQPPDTTPPLSSSDGSGESQSSIDVEKLSVLLQTAAAGTRSSATRVRSGSRIRAPGQGHRRRASQVSKGSMIGTIQEEVANESPRPLIAPNTNNVPAQRHSLESSSSYSSEPLRTPLDFEMVKEPGNLSEPHIIEHQDWEEEQWVIGLRKYYALRSEADEEIRHSRTTWSDTPFSLHALHTFVPPRDPVVMQALLEHSVKNYVPLLSDRHMRRIRSRASSVSRSVPYTRPNSSGGSSGRSKKSHARSRSRSSNDTSFNSGSSGHALRPKCVNDNMPSPRPILAAIAPFSPFSVDLGQNKVGSSEEESFLTFAAIANEQTCVPLNVTKPDVRPRVPSATRRTALGWSKRKAKDEDRKNNNNKENETHGLLVSPSESLRIIRPRPRSRAIANPVNIAPRSKVLMSS